MPYWWRVLQNRSNTGNIEPADQIRRQFSGHESQEACFPLPHGHEVHHVCDQSSWLEKTTPRCLCCLTRMMGCPSTSGGEARTDVSEQVGRWQERCFRVFKSSVPRWWCADHRLRLRLGYNSSAPQGWCSMLHSRHGTCDLRQVWASSQYVRAWQGKGLSATVKWLAARGHAFHLLSCKMAQRPLLGDHRKRQKTISPNS